MRKSQILENVITILEDSQVPLTAPEILLQLKEKSFTIKELYNANISLINLG